MAALFVTHLWSVSSGMNGFYPLSSGADDRYYFQQASDFASGAYIDLSMMPNIYPIVLGWLYTLTVPSLFLGQSFNVIVGALTVVVGVAVAIELTTFSRYSLRDIRHPVNVTGLLLSLYPGHVFYSTQLLKDPMLDFLGLFSVYLAILALRRKGNHGFILWGFWIMIVIAMYFWRGYTVYALLAAVACLWFLKLNVNRSAKIGFIIASFISMAVLPYVVGYGWFASEEIIGFLRRMADFRREVYSIGGSAIGIVLDPHRPAQFVAGWFYSFLTVWLGPFPWQIRSVVHLTALPEAIMMWILFPFVVRAIKQWRRNPSDPAHLLLFFSVILMSGIALFSDNVGANTRLRLLPWMTIMIYVAVEAGKCKGRVNVEAALSYHPQRAGRGTGTRSGFDQRVSGSS
ncbi:MAG: hypothetical protein K6T83_14705 [Alicyclobacillus sp.]|nr:hypothetical protein [Alicyclobacillus sp.]